MEEKRSLRVAVIGCGQLGWVHLSHITRFKLGEVVAVCDFYRPRLEKTGRAFEVPKLYTDPAEMFAGSRPDVVHVVTPPATHADLGIQAMRSGCHVLVEKPMALTLADADRLIAVARETGKSLCVDHNRLFSPPTLAARRMFETGELGDLVGVDFFQGVGFSPRMTLAQLDMPWLNSLPGGLVQDLAPHCLYILLEFLGLPLEFHVVARRNGLLPAAPAEEVRLIMKGERGLGSGTISLSTQPIMNRLTLYGSKGTAQIHLDNFTLVVKKDRFSHPLFNRALGSISEGSQLALATAVSAWRFAFRQQPRYPDILELIRRFYASVQDGAPPPVPPEQGRETVRLIQEVNAAMQAGAVRDGPAISVHPNGSGPRILVTGATGFIGGAVVRRLLCQGIRPRALARPSMKVQALQEQGVEVILGDLSDRETVSKAFQGVEAAFHCAARMGSDGSWEDFERETVAGTENVLNAARSAQIRHLIYLSSLAVYGPPSNGDRITERSAYDPQPEKRGHYSRAKILAEKLVFRYAEQDRVPVTVFRPGWVFGRGKPLPTALLSFPSPLSLSYLVVGERGCLLAVNYIENLVDALMLALQEPGCVGGQFNIVDDEDLTSGEFHRIRGQIDGTRAVFLPPLPFRLAAPGMQVLAKNARSGKLASFSSHALARALTSIRYDTSAVREQLGWRPNVMLPEAIRISLS